jgi:hypothetical protein
MQGDKGRRRKESIAENVVIAPPILTMKGSKRGEGMDQYRVSRILDGEQTHVASANTLTFG